MAPRLSPLLGCLLVLATTAHFARALVQEGDVWMTPAELGPAAVTGKDASDTIRARAARLHLAMACGNEFAFARGFALASRLGKEGYVPPHEGLAQWPVTLMLGKAARLIDQSREGAPCESTLDGDEGAIAADWLGLTLDGQARPNEKAPDGTLFVDRVVNRVYQELYDTIDGASGAPCVSVAHAGEGKVSLSLSDDCLARQIRAVMTDPRHGPWTEKGGVVTPELPGTSASKLPCLSEFKLKVSGVDGDWDMAVIEYTRLASLLYRFGRSTQAIGADVDAAIAALNRRFLTLRSSPEQGATARELFNLVTSCGNLPNQFGDAIDTVSGSGADPGADRYSEAANDAVGKKSFWDSLLRFLAAVVIVVAIALGAALAGAVAGIIAGALAGAVAVAVAVAVVVGLIVLITFLGGGIEETENHLLMQNTSRYLKNKLMMAELSAQDERKGFDTISDLNEDVRSWLLERLQRIAREDFVEYNAKPYNRLSHASILNLLDYACDVSWDYESSRFILNSDRACDDKDRAVVNAAAAVLDLSAAKLAVGSLEGRRLIPYRRLAEENYKYYTGRSIVELTSGADSQLAALQIWTGQMRHAPSGRSGRRSGGDGVAWPGTFGDLAWYSTSRYRPDPIILDMAVNKTIAREQQYRHHTRERYASGNGWLITAGGTDEGPAQGFRSPLGFTIYPPISGDLVNDRGVGVPTTLMTGAQIAGADGKPDGRAKVQQFLRFEGNKKDWGLLDQSNSGTGLNTGKPLWSFSDNNCVAGSFACGLTMRLPSDFDEDTCRTVNIARNLFVVDSTKCAAFNDNDGVAANDIFIAVFQSPMGWGFFEVAQQDAYARSAVAFADAIKANNKDRFADWISAQSSDTIEYFAVTQNRLLKFTPKDEDFSADRRACGVVNHESGARFTISNVPAAQAGACLSVGPRIFIDLNDAKNPIRRGEGGLALELFGR
jgi:hypothetical protein